MRTTRLIYLLLVPITLAFAPASVSASCADDLGKAARPAYGLRITELTTDITHSRYDETAAINLAYVDFPGGTRRLHTLETPLGQLDAEAEFEITLVNARGAGVALDQIPSATVRRLVDVLRGRWDFTLSDCAAFACYLVGAPIRPRDFALNEILDRTPVTEAELKAGDLIGIENDDGMKVHLAIYLGPESGGLYLSQFGSRSPLVVSSLAQMAKFYRAPHLYRYGVGA